MLLFVTGKDIRFFFFDTFLLVYVPGRMFSQKHPFLLALGDVSRGGMSATQRQKFHTDDVKYVQNPVRSAEWSTE